MSYVPAKLRALVVERAAGCCEYCRVNQHSSDVTFHVEHIIAVTHGGKTVEQNLALSCLRCNLHKGTNIAAADPTTDEPTFLYHPRRHRWQEYFQLKGALIEPLSPEGRATVLVLHLNDRERVEERELLRKFDRYPCPEMD
jgi:hypothetical protein